MWSVLCVAGIGSLPAAVLGGPPEPVGKAMYLRYCGACHGPGGKGDGVVSGLMRPRPSDLTQIAKKAGGEFPFMQTLQSIDGTKTIRAHGDPDMPVWGEIFRDQTAASVDRRAAVQGKLLLITDYLRSIQEK